MDEGVYDNTGLRGTPFHPRTAPLNPRRRWVAWDRHAMAETFGDPLAELRALREAAGVLDMSPLSKTQVSGPDAQRFVNSLITRDAERRATGQVFYSPLCNEQGRVVADGIVYRRAEDTFLFSTDPVLNWFRRSATGFEVQIEDETEQYGILSVQGPRSREALERATGRGLSGLRFSRGTEARVGGARAEILRQGFTGELGYELWVPAADAPAVWDAILAAGRPLGLMPCGNTVMDWARVEAGLLIVGPDYTSARMDRLGTPMDVAGEDQAYPSELGLGGFVDFDKADFIGRQALVELEAHGGAPSRLVGLELDWRHAAALYTDRGLAPEIHWRSRWYPLPVREPGGRRVGRATSVTWSPTLKKLIGFGHVPREQADIGTRLAVDWPVAGEAGDVPAVVVDLPFVEVRRG
jgi:aminomethyltransferase